jgi:hypothetical protein
MADATPADRQRLYDLLTAGTGIIRTRNAELEREAGERAEEARHQVGLVVHPENPELDLILHPTQAEAEARLGPQWSGKGVGELATWNYLFLDPVGKAAQGLLGSPVHRAVLDNPAYMYWGAGIYTELPPGASEIGRRWYFIIWLSKLVPAVEPRFADVPFDSPIHDDVEYLAQRGLVTGGTDGLFHPEDPVTRGDMARLLARIHDDLEP